MNGEKKEAAGDLRLEDGEFLRLVGDRIRDLRAQRGMTRKILARDSGVSERYLAQLESGQGNISIVRLREVAAAMGMPLQDVVSVGPERPPELTLLIQYLQRLSPAKLAEARQLLMSTFESQGRNGRIALIGLRGAGKTTLGNRLAKHLGVPFVELAQEIEAEAGMTLSEVFSLYGQAAYRRYERRALKAVQEKNQSFVLSPGGSVVSEPATFEELLTACYTIWIKASPEEHMARVVAQGDHRPMIDNQEAMKDLERILSRREAMYVKADAVVDTSGQSIDASFAALLAAIPK
jgi:XRE family aerobic/anaerobic benzoate catabolism transcriptional regulator